MSAMDSESNVATPLLGVARGGARVFERQVLIFPLLVVVLASMSFLFGGRCSIWQWWTAVGVVVGGPFFHSRDWKDALCGGILFFGLLLAVKGLLPPLFWDNAMVTDMPICHLPMIQLLAEGWNPVCDPLGANIMGQLGLDYWGMAPLHVVFGNKTMAIFAAVAYGFVGDATALSIPGLAFLWLGVVLAAARVFKGFSRWIALAAVALVLPMVAFRMPVDLEVAFASCGLLLTMQDALRKKGCDWVSLAVWGAWMMNLKATGLIAAPVFLVMFTVAKCRRERGDWRSWAMRFSVLGGSLAILWCLISWNPFGTSWKTFGHPLYPYATVDASRFPVCDLTSDMLGNDDAQAMGKIGAFAHAYLSPELTKAFFRWRLRRNDFSPQRAWWSRREFPSPQVRVALWTMFAILFIVPRGRCWGMCGLILLLMVPSDKVGFTRYQPWLSALGCLALVMVAEWAEVKMTRKQIQWLSRFLIVVLAMMAGLWGWRHARDLEYKARETSLVRERIRPLFCLWGRNTDTLWIDRIDTLSNGLTSPRYHYLTSMLNRTRLLVKQMGWEGKTAILPTTGLGENIEFGWIDRDWPNIDRQGRRTNSESISWKSFNVWDGEEGDSDVEAWMITPFGYWVPVDEQTEHVMAYELMGQSRKGETTPSRLWRRMKYCAKAWGMTYPHEVVRWLMGGKSAACENPIT